MHNSAIFLDSFGVLPAASQVSTTFTSSSFLRFTFSFQLFNSLHQILELLLLGLVLGEPSKVIIIHVIVIEKVEDVPVFVIIVFVVGRVLVPIFVLERLLLSKPSLSRKLFVHGICNSLIFGLLNREEDV